jgi:hypothetical protein
MESGAKGLHPARFDTDFEIWQRKKVAAGN